VGKCRANRGALWLCLLLQAVLGVPAALGLTLCVDADGCFAIEIAHTETSCLRAVHTAPPGRATGSLRVGEPLCHDLPVLESRVYEARVSRGGPAPALVATASRFAARPAPRQRPARSSEARTRLAPRRLRRSVVLIV